jgi:chromate transport protein ChrA
MAGYKGHIAGAAAFAAVYLVLMAYVAWVYAVHQQFSDLELVAYPLALVALTILFGLWPDVDTDSKGRRLFYWVFALVDVFLIATERFEAAAYLGFFALLPALDHHRGWTHTWWAMLLIPSPLLLWPYLAWPEQPLVGLPFYGAAVVGYLSHLYMDGLVFRRWRRKRR